MFFSLSTQGFYVGDSFDKAFMPSDCAEVTSDVESKIRAAIIDDLTVTAIIDGTLTTTSAASAT